MYEEKNEISSFTSKTILEVWSNPENYNKIGKHVIKWVSVSMSFR